MRADRRKELERRQGVQKPLAAGQGKTFPGAVTLHVAGRNVPCGSPKCQAWENPESGWQRAGRLAAPGPRLCRRHCGVGAWIQPASRHLVLLVSDAQDEVVQGGAKDGVGVVVERLEQWDMALPWDEQCEPGRLAASAAVAGLQRCFV